MAASKGSWTATQEAMEHQGGGIFLKLENDGDTAVLAFCGAPLPRHTAYDEKSNTSEPFDPAKHDVKQKRTKYLINAYVFSFNGSVVDEMKIVDMSFKTLTTVIALKDKYGFGKCPFEIARAGAARDKKTVYHILPENRELTADDIAKIGHVDPKDPDNWVEGSVKLLDLEQVSSGDSEGTEKKAEELLRKRNPKNTAASIPPDPAAYPKDVKKDARTKPANGAAPHATNGTVSAQTPAAAAPAASVPATAAPSAGPAMTPVTLSKEVVARLIDRLKPIDREKGLKPFLAAFPYATKVSDIHAAHEGQALALVDKLTAPPPAVEEVDPFS